MANITSLLNTIRTAVYGRDMRSALHDAIKAVNEDVETKAVIQHASTSTTYGSATGTNYGHTRLSDSINSSSSTSGGYAATPYAVKQAYDLANGKAPTSHASSSTTYGKGDGSNYGHLRLSNSTSSSYGTSDGYAATPSAVKAAYDLADGKSDEGHTHLKSDITDFPTSMTPTSHASSSTTYGKGDGSNYGHLRLSNSTSSSYGTSDGYAATPSAVKAAYDLAKDHAHSKSDITDFPSSMTPTDGSVTMDKLSADVKNAIATGSGGSASTNAISADIVVPINGWVSQSDDDGYGYRADVALASITSDQIPIITIKKESLQDASVAGVCSVAQTISGALRLLSKRKPASDLYASLTLLKPEG